MRHTQRLDTMGSRPSCHGHLRGFHYTEYSQERAAGHGGSGQRNRALSTGSQGQGQGTAVVHCGGPGDLWGGAETVLLHVLQLVLGWRGEGRRRGFFEEDEEKGEGLGKKGRKEEAMRGGKEEDNFFSAPLGMMEKRVQ